MRSVASELTIGDFVSMKSGLEGRNNMFIVSNHQWPVGTSQ